MSSDRSFGIEGSFLGRKSNPFRCPLTDEFNGPKIALIKIVLGREGEADQFGTIEFSAYGDIL